MDLLTCPTCHAQVSAGANYCDNCGSPLNIAPEAAVTGESTLRCPQCDTIVGPDDTYCRNCGSPLGASAAPAAQPLDPGFCPNCNAAVRAEDLFCDNCGHSLRAGIAIAQDNLQQPPSAMPDSDVASRPVQTDPRLVVQPDGIVLKLDPDQDIYIIGREDPSSGSFPDVDLVPFGGEEGGVSRRHAQIYRSGESYYIEDLNSVNYTFVNKRKVPAGIEHLIRNGDEIRLGRVILRFETG